MNDFEKALLTTINNSDLPLEAILYVMRHVYGLVDAKYQEALKQMEQTTSDESGVDKAD